MERNRETFQFKLEQSETLKCSDSEERKDNLRQFTIIRHR